MERGSFNSTRIGGLVGGEILMDKGQSRTIKINTKYRHFKGNEYLVLYIAKHSETLEEMVVYQALYGDFGIWVRPLDMFLESVDRGGVMTYRFEEII